MISERSRKVILGLLISTASLAVICVILTTLLVTRPVVVRTIEVAGKDAPGQVVIDLGGGRKITAPGDGILEYEGTLVDDKTPNIYKQDEDAKARGVRLNITGTDKLLLELDFSLPETSIPGGPTSLAGYANLGIKAMFGNGGATLYIVAGIAIIIGCVLIFWLKAYKLGLGFIAGGIAMIMVVKFFEEYPWVLWIFLLIGVGVVGFLLWDCWKKRKVEQTNEVLISAGEDLPAKVKKMFTKSVKAEAQARGLEGTTRSVVTAVKKKRGPRVNVDLTEEEQALRGDLERNADPQVIVVPAPTGGTE